MPLYLFALLRFLGPSSAESWCTKQAMTIAEGWIGTNNLIIDLFQKLEIDIQGDMNLTVENWYLVLCNHQTWVDILILQRVFNQKIPLLKFFTKQELVYVPLIGIAWWALDFPLMKRYSAEFLKKHPELRGKDLEATRKSVEKFKLTPVAILNFLEGTRFTAEKAKKQNTPYQNLLKPKGGGAALIINGLGDRIDCVLNITIHYPDGVPGFFEFLSGHTKRVTFIIEKLLPPDQDSKAGRQSLQTWINEIWLKKDQQLIELNNKGKSGSAA